MIDDSTTPHSTQSAIPSGIVGDEELVLVVLVGGLERFS
jgi:hypothetical protein